MRYSSSKIRSYESILNGDTSVRLLWTCFFTALMAASALSFRLWFTPVPITLQVLGVILSGLVLGSRWGAVCQLQYLALGAMGLPIFAEFKAGPAAFAGPTGGYLMGFVLGAFLSGWTFEKLEGRPGLPALIASAAGIVGVYLPGMLWLATLMTAGSGRDIAEALRSAWALGVVPFVGVDAVKAVIAAGIVEGSRFVHRPRR